MGKCYFTCSYLVCANNKYAPQMPHMPISLHAHMRQLSVYASFKLTPINNVTRSTGMPDFTLLAYAPKQISLPLGTYMSHHTATVAYI